MYVLSDYGLCPILGLAYSLFRSFSFCISETPNPSNNMFAQ